MTEQSRNSRCVCGSGKKVKHCDCTQGDTMPGLLSRAALGSCFLCGQQASIGSYFKPNDPQNYGAAPGKTRVIFYGMCEPCLSRPTAQDDVEFKMLMEYAGQ